MVMGWNLRTNCEDFLREIKTGEEEDFDIDPYQFCNGGWYVRFNGSLRVADSCKGGLVHEDVKDLADKGINRLLHSDLNQL